MGQLVAITSAYDAAKFMLEEWPDETGPKKHWLAKEILLKCLEGGCSVAVARVAFVEALREAGLFIQADRPPINWQARSEVGQSVKLPGKRLKAPTGIKSSRNAKKARQPD